MQRVGSLLLSPVNGKLNIDICLISKKHQLHFEIKNTFLIAITKYISWAYASFRAYLCITIIHN